jgi:Spy/CpxP family protein refolding chaperone
MKHRNWVFGAVVSALVVMASVGEARAQEAAGGRRGGRRFDPVQMRERMLERMQQNLEATDEEWTVIKPRIEKVMTLSMENRLGGMRRGRGRSGDDAQLPEDASAVQKASAELRQALSNDNATAEQIKDKLTALRKARDARREQLAQAQEALRELLTQRQEAQLVLQGYLN